ncbi:MAG: hypothetical protein N2Z74_07285, partial [Syntrophales bacterium]|nr:hypothetical protein [Syntrophales bacterium]
FTMLARIAREEGLEGFTADVLAVNKAMLRIFEKSPYPVKAVLSGGAYELTVTFIDPEEKKGDGEGI